jgi:hypothetical protein
MLFEPLSNITCSIVHLLPRTLSLFGYGIKGEEYLQQTWPEYSRTLSPLLEEVQTKPSLMRMVEVLTPHSILVEVHHLETEAQARRVFLERSQERVCKLELVLSPVLAMAYL